mmetsp:Transcript_9703/g.24924  ORF Transcript_9703/g.24924 Transcript_9703/m.24924 type:complete len:226 (-) Transcript_9703:962-1639(-)
MCRAIGVVVGSAPIVVDVCAEPLHQPINGGIVVDVVDCDTAAAALTGGRRRDLTAPSLARSRAVSILRDGVWVAQLQAVPAVVTTISCRRGCCVLTRIGRPPGAKKGVAIFEPSVGVGPMLGAPPLLHHYVHRTLRRRQGCVLQDKNLAERTCAVIHQPRVDALLVEHVAALQAPYFRVGLEAVDAHGARVGGILHHLWLVCLQLIRRLEDNGWAPGVEVAESRL